jgi:hypothetical protein
MVHDFRNFGEDVYRRLREICSISLLKEVDRATYSFVIRDIRRQDIGTVTAGIKEVIRRYRWEDTVRYRRVDSPGSDPPPH